MPPYGKGANAKASAGTIPGGRKAISLIPYCILLLTSYFLLLPFSLFPVPYAFPLLSPCRRMTVTSSGLFSTRRGKEELPRPRLTHMTVLPIRYMPAV